MNNYLPIKIYNDPTLDALFRSECECPITIFRRSGRKHCADTIKFITAYRQIFLRIQSFMRKLHRLRQFHARMLFGIPSNPSWQ